MSTFKVPSSPPGRKPPPAQPPQPAAQNLRAVPNQQWGKRQIPALPPGQRAIPATPPVAQQWNTPPQPMPQVVIRQPILPREPAAQERKPRRGINKKTAGIAAALVLVAGLSAVVFLNRDKLLIVGVGSTTGQNSDENAVSVKVNGNSGGAKAFNISMSGLFACDTENVFFIQGGEVVDKNGKTVYPEVLYYMNARDGELFGVTARGEIVRVDKNGDSQIIRQSGYPSLLTLDEDTLYFIEDGLWRMDLSGKAEQIAAGYISPACLAAENGMVYYIGEDDALYRMGAGDAEQLFSLPIERFCVDGDQIFFTQVGDGTLWRLESEGDSKSVSDVMAEIVSPRYAVIDGLLYFGAPGQPVSRAKLPDGNAENILTGESGLFYILNDEIQLLDDLPAPPDYTLVDRAAP